MLKIEKRMFQKLNEMEEIIDNIRSNLMDLFDKEKLPTYKEGVGEATFSLIDNDLKSRMNEFLMDLNEYTNAGDDFQEEKENKE